MHVVACICSNVRQFQSKLWTKIGSVFVAWPCFVSQNLWLIYNYPPLFISYANVRNYYGPYVHCSLDKGVACAQHIQLLAHTCACAWYECTLTSTHISKCMQTQESLGNMKILGSHPCWHKQ